MEGDKYHREGIQDVSTNARAIISLNVPPIQSWYSDMSTVGFSYEILMMNMCSKHVGFALRSLMDLGITSLLHTLCLDFRAHHSKLLGSRECCVCFRLVANGSSVIQIIVT